VLPKTFANSAPIIVKKIIAKSKITDGCHLNLIEKSLGFSLLNNRADKKSVTELTNTTTLKVDNGPSTPTTGNNIFRSKPRNIKKTRLSPTDKTSAFNKETLILKNLKIKKPGMKERKTKLKICLIKNMSKATAIRVST
jgi:hypothetical protein